MNDFDECVNEHNTDGVLNNAGKKINSDIEEDQDRDSVIRQAPDFTPLRTTHFTPRTTF